MSQTLILSALGAAALYWSWQPVEERFVAQYNGTSYPVAIMASMPGCGYCSQAAPEWRRLAKVARHSLPRVRIATMDCVKDAEQCKKWSIHSYPTFIFVRSADAKPLVYEGSTRSVSAWLRWISSQLY